MNSRCFFFSCVSLSLIQSTALHSGCLRRCLSLGRPLSGLVVSADSAASSAAASSAGTGSAAASPAGTGSAAGASAGSGSEVASSAGTAPALDAAASAPLAAPALDAPALVDPWRSPLAAPALDASAPATTSTGDVGETLISSPGNSGIGSGPVLASRMPNLMKTHC